MPPSAVLPCSGFSARGSAALPLTRSSRAPQCEGSARRECVKAKLGVGGSFGGRGAGGRGRQREYYGRRAAVPLLGFHHAAVRSRAVRRGRQLLYRALRLSPGGASSAGLGAGSDRLCSFPPLLPSPAPALCVVHTPAHLDRGGRNWQRQRGGEGGRSRSPSRTWPTFRHQGRAGPGQSGKSWFTCGRKS